MRATSTGVVNTSPPSLAGKAKSARSLSDWSIRPVVLGIKTSCLILSSMGTSRWEMLGVVLIRKDHLREEPKMKALYDSCDSCRAMDASPSSSSDHSLHFSLMNSSLPSLVPMYELSYLCPLVVIWTSLNIS